MGPALATDRTSRSLAVVPALALALLCALSGCQGAKVSGADPAGPATARSDAAAADDGPSGAQLPDVGVTLTPPADMAASDPCAACAPGQSCSGGACIDDCRPTGARPCAAPMVCDFLSGRCAAPDAGCILTGTPVTCGKEEFPARCGPGSRCNDGVGCVPDSGCQRIVCDASNFCRGADCPQSGGGGVTQLTLDPVPDAMAGTMVSPSAVVMAQGLCGLTATFELQKDLELFVSAYNDQVIWRVPVNGQPATRYISETKPIGGVTADRNGALYYTLQDSGVIRKVLPTAGAPMPTMFATLPMTYGLARLTFGPDGLLYAVASREVYQLSAAGAVTRTWTIAGSTFLTGLVFDKDGALLAGQHWPLVWRLPPGAAAFERYVDATPMAPNAIGPWNEGMTLGPDGNVYVGVFPVGNLDGIIYTIGPMGRLTRLLGQAELMRVPGTRYSGIHGVAFGGDGTLYFANQNTSGSTREPLGQVLARRPNGALELVASGLNYDWPRGYDGDIVVAQATAESASSPIDATGRARATLPAPRLPGVYGIRVLVTDPRTGAISVARGSVRVR